MNWNKIKTFLILLFIIINLYLIISTSGSVLQFDSVTKVSKETVTKTCEIIKNNYNISLDPQIVPLKLKNLKLLEVTNYIYSEEFEETSKYPVSTQMSEFKIDIDTATFSYNEKNARSELNEILASLEFSPENMKIDFSLTDSGPVANVYLKVAGVTIFNSSLKAEFSPKKIMLSGTLYLPNGDKIYSDDNTYRMTDITSILIDVAERASVINSKKIENIVYGYYVSSYDDNSLSKISTSVPCYLIETDNARFLYDAIDGKFIKQEDI